MKESKPNSKLILTIVEKLRFSDIEPFLASLRQTGYDGSLVVFASRLSCQTLAGIKEYGARVIPFRYFSVRYRRPPLLFWPFWKWLFKRTDGFEKKCALAKRVFFLMSLRFIFFYEYLLQHRGRYDRIMLSDIRDVFFQRDPFSWNYEFGLHAFLEEKGRTIATCSWNRRMVEEAFGPSAFERIGDREPSCAGVTIGDQESILQYLYHVISLAFEARQMRLVSPVDQGIHNYVVHRPLLPKVHLHANGTSGVLTMGLMDRSAIKIGSSGEMLNFDGSVPAILHQYDRHREIQELLTCQMRRMAT
jgi:hypothetical protein